MLASNPTPTQTRGFTLIETLMVLGITAVLVAVALPSYRAAGLKAKRADGVLALSGAASQQHRFFISCERYGERIGPAESCDAATLVGSGSSPGGLYDLSTRPVPGGFSVEATARSTGSQAADTGCTTLTLRYQDGVLTREPPACF